MRTSAAARAALSALEKHGWLVRLEPGALVRGKNRKEAWRIVDKAKEVHLIEANQLAST